MEKSDIGTVIAMHQWCISTDELYGLSNIDAVIFDCRFALENPQLGSTLYDNGHIPGAYHLSMEESLSGPKGKHGGRHPIPDAETFSKKMRECGVNHNTLVIAYDDNRLAGAARLWWLLLLFGHTKVKVLNGGFAAWQAEGFTLAFKNNPTNNRLGNFMAVKDKTRVVDHRWVKQRLADEKVTYIDSREPSRYLGLEEPIDPVAGRIPGAVNAPWQNVTDERGFIKPIGYQQEFWRNMQVSETPVVYCGSGVTACVNLLSLALAGINHAKLYAGSWSDWCSYPSNPIESDLGRL
jgi:thiosulfate/3-mercaptopyruvate sulfurtransferase